MSFTREVRDRSPHHPDLLDKLGLSQAQGDLFTFFATQPRGERAGLTDEEMVLAFTMMADNPRTSMRAQSGSGLRTRRKELAEKKILIQVGEGRTRMGNKARKWAMDWTRWKTDW